MFAEGIADNSVMDLFRQKATRSLATLGQWVWQDDSEFEIDYHIRRSALPQPGRIRELLALCSRLHATLLDRHRPLWEIHLIEGLADGRFALYFKAHHAMLDGVAAMRMLAKSLSWQDDERGMPVPWAPFRDGHPRHAAADDAAPVDQLWVAADAVRDVLGIAPSLAARVARGLTGGGLPLQAPRSVLNVPITAARRFAAQDWPIERIKAVASASGTTLNDVVLAMCSGALRAYLLMRNALPEESLVAMVPVSLRDSDNATGSPEERDGGNAVGAVLCDLGTVHDDPAKRLQTVRESMLEGKRSLAGMSEVQVLAMSSLVLSPVVVEHVLHTHGRFRPPFNVLISNIPGPKMPMFWNGARLDGLYPLGVPFHGEALNITCISSAGSMGFGIIGCSRNVPSLQRIIGFLDDELSALEKAVA
jgi:WS/DGAT/MGAT family acyltransferase